MTTTTIAAPPATTLDDLDRLQALYLDAVKVWSKATDPALKAALLAVVDQMGGLKTDAAERAAELWFRGDLCDLWTAVGRHVRP